MRKYFIWVAILAGVLLCGTKVSAQVLYSCDFEDAAENALWVINKTSNARPLANYKNIWHIGTAGNCADGLLGLHICPQGDTTLNSSISSTTTDFIVAYRDNINLGIAGTFSLSFDWKGSGKSLDGLYVYWIPSSYTNNINSNYGTASTPAALDPYRLTILRGAPTWRNYSTTFTSSTPTGKLLFIWFQTAGNAINPPAAVDNIEIAQTSSTCPAPTNLTYNATGGTLTWTGSATSYDVRYCNTHTGIWTTDNGVTGNTYTLQNISEGTYTFQVRANCGDNIHSAWSSISQFIWIAGVRCIDLYDIGASTAHTGVCYVGEHTAYSHTALQWSTTPQMVDYGPSSNASMHTLHTQVGEIDPNTSDNGGLLTIPEDEIATIRLGAYTSSGEDARIEYKYKVQSGMSDLLDLRYACVLESGGHSADNPFFQLDILDQNGRQIDGCTHAYFVADMSGTSGTGWHQEGDIFWCDWRTVTVSLMQFVGQTLTIRLTSSRCIYDTHFGYAYFTLSCRSGGLEGVACNDFSTDHFTAPSGFNYEWYKRSEPGTILSTDSTLHISNQDTAIYAVKVKSKLTDGCYYILTANPNPRFPETDVTYQASQENCQNIVRFANNSRVVIVNRLDTTIKSYSDDRLDDVLWNFDDGTSVVSNTDSVVEHIFPQSGGTFNVKVKSMMSGGICENEQTYTMTLPELGDKRQETVIQHCYSDGTPYTYNGIAHTQSFQDSTIYRLASGCDSTDVISVNFVEKVTEELYDTICAEVNNYVYNGTVYSESGNYPVKFLSHLNCDSIVTLHLYKHPQPIITVDSAFATCADEASGIAIPYSLKDMDMTVDSIHVVMGDEAVQHGFEASYAFKAGDILNITWPEDITPNVYQGKVIFSSPICRSYAFDFKIELYYPSSALDQKNGIVAVMNTDYNGGYDFVSYQWYRNGERMDGETKSYVRVSDEEDMNAEYYVVVLRGEDNVVLRSCPIIYTGGGWREALEDIREESGAVKVLNNGILYIIRDGVWYTVLGTTIRKYVQ